MRRRLAPLIIPILRTSAAVLRRAVPRRPRRRPAPPRTSAHSEQGQRDTAQPRRPHACHSMEGALQFVSDVLAPHNASTFLLSFFEMAPAVLRRPATRRDYFTSLISVEDVANLFSRFPRSEDNSSFLVTASASRSWDLVRKHWDYNASSWTTLGVSRGASPIQLTADDARFLYEQEGYTLVVNQLQHLSPRVAFAAEQLSLGLGRHPVSSNLYATVQRNRGTQGFAAHFDWMDAIVVQVSGCKRWRIYEPLLQLPTPDMVYELVGDEMLTIAAEFDLSAGSVLTIPRGWPHEAATNCSTDTATDIAAATSVHLTFGIESAVATSVEVLLHHYLRQLLFPDDDADDARRRRRRRRLTWAHLALHAAATEHDAVILRRALPFDLLGSAPKDEHISLVRDAMGLASRRLNQSRAARVGRDLGLETTTDRDEACSSSTSPRLHAPTYISHFLSSSAVAAFAQEESEWQEDVAGVWRTALKQLSLDSLASALAATLRNHQSA